MRRTLAAAILGISLWIGSLAWSGFLVTKTVLDPSRSEAVADALYDDETIRAQLATNIAGALEASLPSGVTVDRAVLDAAALAALESPAVEAVIKDALVASHQAFLGEGEAPEALDAGAFGAAARDALVESRPELAGALPPAPEILVPLPTERIPNLGPVRRGLETVVPLAALVAAAGAFLALVVTKNRPAILRRAGFWSLGLSAAVLAFAYGLPALSRRFAPDQSEIVAAFVNAMAAQTRGPALVAAAAGLGGIVASFVWRAAPMVAGALDGGDDPAPRTRRRTSAPMPAGPAPAWYARRDLPTSARRPRPDAAASAPPRRRPDPDGFARRPPPPVADPHPGYPSGPAPTRVTPPASPTRVTSAHDAPAPPRPAPPGPASGSASGRAGSPRPDAPRTRWVDGVGHVLESSETIPDDARWVPGVGYVVDDV